MSRILLFLAIVFLPLNCPAGEVDVVKVQVESISKQKFSFSVTLLHDDEGWEHYADRWEIRAPNGKILGTRTLYHPHVDEQPFTRSLSGVDIPVGINAVEVWGHDSVHGYGERTQKVELSGG